MKYLHLLFVLLGCLFCFPSTGLGGAPLITDDPGILDPGSWEVITAMSAENRKSASVFHAPLLDMSLGVSSNSQISFSIPRTVLKLDGESEWSGPGVAALGYKWRFLESGNWEWAVAISYASVITRDLENAGLDSPGNLSLPVLAAWTGTHWTLNSQVTWNRSSDGEESWDYGFALMRPITLSTVLMAELYGDSHSLIGDSSLNFQLGIDYDFGNDIHFLLAAGSRVTRGADRLDRLSYTVFFGVQTFL